MTDSLQRCATCCHWQPSDRWDAKAANMRVCIAVEEGWSIADDASADVKRDYTFPDQWGAEKPDPADAYMNARIQALKAAKATVWDGSEYCAELITSGDFGCVLHKLSPDDAVSMDVID